MKILIDTHILVWAMSGSESLSSRARDMLAHRGNDILFSAASIWEIAIKFALRRSDFNLSPADAIAYAADMEFVELPVSASAAARVAHLPPHHRDPFDRLLIAQAIDEDAELLTADTQLAAYGPPVLLMTQE